MSRLAWNATGNRLFEAGLDRGVLYTTNGVGVAWNGLISVKEGGSGGDPTPYFIDGYKYLNISTREEFAGTIEAFTYPDEFGVHDGTYALATGLIAQQQRRKPFGFSYRTRVGNDLVGIEYGYKLHIVYDALAEPSDKSHNTVAANIEPSNFSWAFSTKAKKPKSVAQLAPMAHIVIDSTKTNPILLRFLEEQLYGSDLQQARLISLDDLFSLFERTQLVYSIVSRPYNGLNPLLLETDYTGDVFGSEKQGYFDEVPESRLVPTGVNGFYTLGITSDASGVTEDANDEGIYTITDGSMVEDLPADPGTYIINPLLILDDVNDLGTYVPFYYTPVILPPVAGLTVDPNEDGFFIIVNDALLESANEYGVYIDNAESVKDNPNEPGTYLY